MAEYFSVDPVKLESEISDLIVRDVMDARIDKVEKVWIFHFALDLI